MLFFKTTVFIIIISLHRTSRIRPSTAKCKWSTPRTLAHKSSWLYLAPLHSPVFFCLFFVCVCIVVLLLVAGVCVFSIIISSYYTLTFFFFFFVCWWWWWWCFCLFVCLFFHYYHFFTLHKLHLSQDGQLKMQHPTHTHSPETFTVVNGPTNVSK